MKEKKIFFRLISKDGLKGEIKELADFIPEIKTAIYMKPGGQMSFLSVDLSQPRIESRVYRCHGSTEVIFLEYHEVE